MVVIITYQPNETKTESEIIADESVTLISQIVAKNRSSQVKLSSVVFNRRRGLRPGDEGYDESAEFYRKCFQYLMKNGDMVAVNGKRDTYRLSKKHLF
jgi:hypothetical protein